MITDEQRMIVEFENYKNNMLKMEKSIDEIKVLTTRFLEGFNRVLEAQSESRACDKQMYMDVTALKEKVILLEASLTQLQGIDAYTEIKRFIEHSKNEKEITDFMTTTREHITSTSTNIKILNGVAATISTIIVGYFLSKMLGG